MKTEEAIEFLKEAKKDLFREGAILKLSRIYRDIPKVIVLLQRGEKYEKMFLKVVKWENEDKIIVKSDLDELKQKYFPKEVNRENLETFK